jgi:hypothetical protein
MSSNLKVNTILPSTGTAIGIGTLSGNVDVLGHIVGHNTPNISGINSITASHFYGDGSNLTGVISNIVGDTSPQLGANLDTNTKCIDFGDSNTGTVNRLRFGASTDFEIFHNGTNNHIDCHTAGQDLYIRPTKDVYFQDYSTDDIFIKMIKDGAVELYHNDVSMLETESRGAFVKKGNGSDTTFTVGSTDASGVRICLDGDSNGDAYGNDYAFLQHDSSGDFIISADNPAGNSNLIFKSGNSSERARIDSSGRLLIGTTATDNRDGYNSSLQIAGTSGDDSSISIGRYSDNVSYPAFVFSKSRNAAINSHTRVNTGDYLGGIQFQGDDGTRFLVGASIVAQAASPVADYDMATDLIISTNSGTTSPNKSMTLDHQGRFTKPNTPFVMVHINSRTDWNTTGSFMVVPWDTIHARSTNSNMGSHFNTSNHRFTAPVDGRYLFVLSMNIRGDNILYHRINGANVSGAEYRMTQLVWDHTDASFIYDMNANDYYDMTSQLYDSNGHRWNGGGNNTFGWDTLSIYLLG